MRGTRVRIVESKLRSVIGRIMRESGDLSSKPGELVSRMVALNADLEPMGCRVALMLGGGPDSDSQVTVSFCLQQTEGGDLVQELTGPPGLELMALRSRPDRDGSFLAWIASVKDRLPFGWVAMRRDPSVGPCRPERGSPAPFVVQETGWTREGWGPLLYDVAVELGTTWGGGLMPDRQKVSPDARAVWATYADRRPDVRTDPTDLTPEAASELGFPQVTPGVAWDDCEQGSAVRHAGRGWAGSPLSRVARKEPSVVPELERLGLLLRGESVAG
jgi:hypothetical protein